MTPSHPSKSDWYSERFSLRVYCPKCESYTVGNDAYPVKCGGCDNAHVEQMPLQPICGHEHCDRPAWNPSAVEREPHVLHCCALHEIASYNAEELASWDEENAADMVRAARAQLHIEDGSYGLVPGIDY